MQKVDLYIYVLKVDLYINVNIHTYIHTCVTINYQEKESIYLRKSKGYMGGVGGKKGKGKDDIIIF